jgi:hypothetical protein
MADLTENEKKLRDALWSLKYYEDKISVKNDRENAIIIACLVAHQYDCVDEMLDIVEKNKSKTLDDVMIILTREGFFPKPEIVDDDELDDDEK